MTHGQIYTMRDGILTGNPTPPVIDWHPVFGTAVTAYPNTGHTQAQEFAAHETACGRVGIHRVYDATANMNLTWSTIAAGAANYDGWQDRWIWVSVKPDVIQLANGSLDANIQALFDSIPASKPGIKIMWTCWHEPEAKVKQAVYGGPELFTADEWKAAAYKFGQLVRAQNRDDFLYGPIFMSKFTLNTPDYGVNAIWSAGTQDLNDVIDFIGWDPYNEDSNKNNYSSTFQGQAGVEYYFTDIVVWSQNNTPGKPIAIGETGFVPDETTLTRRPDFLNALETFAIGQRFLAVCYFDSGVGNGPWFLRAYEATRGNTATLTNDAGSTSAWAAIYSRHSLKFQGAGSPWL